MIISGGAPPRAGAGRCLLVWLLVGLVVSVVVLLCVPALAEARAAVAEDGWRTLPLDRLLVPLLAAVSVTAAGWLWVVAGLVALGAARGRSTAAVPGCPGPLRRAVLAACGVAVGAGLLGGLAAPAGATYAPAPVVAEADPAAVLATAGPDLDGLPVPDRTPVPPTRGAPHDGPRAAPTASVVVAPGDCLWDLAAAQLTRDLGHAPAPAAVDRRWREVHRLNAAVVGDDPDLIRPGQRLRMLDPEK